MDAKTAITNARMTVKARFDAVSAWLRRYQAWALTVATVLSILLIVWARLGFTFEVSRFFAQSAPTDPNGNCVFKTNFNAPEGAWFCKSLQCQLDGNPSGGQEFPPEGPAARLNVSRFGTICDQGVIDTPTVGCVQRLDATPKCSNGKECFPPKDPLWTCTGPVEMGRDGSDFYDCYVPRIHLKGPGQVTCTANTGLSGDSISFTVVGAGGATPAPTPPPPGAGEPAAGQMSGTCTGGATPTITVKWSKTPPAGAQGPFNEGSPAVVNKTTGTQTVQLNPAATDRGSYWEWTDTPIQSGQTYAYRAKYGANAGTNTYNVIASPESCGAATPTPAPTATAAPLSCSPPSQTVQPGQPASFRATGGSGIYFWTFQGQRRDGNPLSLVVDQVGTYSVVVSDAVTSATCSLVVATVSGAPTGVDLALRSSIRNFTGNGQYGNGTTARPGQQVQVRVALDAVGSVPNVIVKAALPDTLTYVPSSTTISGAPTSLDAITQGGLAVGSLTGTREITFVAAVKSAASLPAGTLSSAIVLTAQGDGVAQVAGQVTVTINNAPVAPGAGTVQTGPGETTVLALMVSALLTLLYVSYTHTAGYRSREAEGLGEKHDPLDFNS